VFNTATKAVNWYSQWSLQSNSTQGTADNLQSASWTALQMPLTLWEDLHWL